MKIMFVLHALVPGGAERVAATLINHWANTGDELFVVTIASTDTDFYELDSRVKRVALNLARASRNWRDFVPARSAVCGRSPTAVVRHQGVGPNSGESNSDTASTEVDHGHRAAGRDAIPGWPGVTRSSKGRQEPQYDAAKP